MFQVQQQAGKQISIIEFMTQARNTSMNTNIAYYPLLPPAFVGDMGVGRGH